MRKLSNPNTIYDIARTAPRHPVIWGVKAGTRYGFTDDYGYGAVDGKVSIHDWQPPSSTC